MPMKRRRGHDVDVSAFKGGRLEVVVATSVVRGEVSVGELGVIRIDRSGVQRFTLTSGHSHGIDSDAA